MKKEPRLLLSLALLLAFATTVHAADAPEARISAKGIEAAIYLPDAQKGFYRGTRFDWSGVINSLKAGGHSYYGPWFTKFDPSVRDFNYQDSDIIVGAASGSMGPTEEFQTPLGFDTAKPGDPFVKIGVGVLRRPDDQNYASFRIYDIVDGGKWTVKQTANSVVFTHVLDSASSPYKYVYTKTVRLSADGMQMVMEHSLKNTGTLAIHTRLYNHNFLRLDNTDTGEGLTVTLPFEIKVLRAPDPALAKIEGNKFVYLKTLTEKDRAQAGLGGFRQNAADYDIRIESAKLGAGMRIRGDQPIETLNLWSIRSVMAVEPFIKIDAEPGKEMTWKYTYDYYSVPRR